MKNKHTLIIHSGNDAEASCSCGKWEYAATGPKTRAEIDKEHEKHIDNAEERKAAVC